MNANLWIIFGTLIMVSGMAIGGLMTTYGWNLKTSKETRVLLEETRLEEQEIRRKGIIINVSFDVVTNLLRIEDAKFTVTEEDELSKYVIYPRFQTAALSSVMDSALFYNKKHRTFLDQVNTTLNHLTHINRSLDVSEMHTGSIGMTPEKIASFRKKIRDGKLRHDSIKNLKKLKDIMLSHYEDLFLDQFENELGKDAKTWVQRYRSQKNETKSAN